MKPSEDPPARPLCDPDRFYQALVDAHQGLDAAQSMLLNARLILLLAQHVDNDAQAHALLHEAARGIAARSAGPERTEEGAGP
jgi:Protein of unknown function (DUF2783)